MRRASIKETGEEISEAEWARFDAAVRVEGQLGEFAARREAVLSEQGDEVGLGLGGDRQARRRELALDEERLRATAAACAPRGAAR